MPSSRSAALLLALIVACSRNDDRHGPLAEQSFGYLARESEAACSEISDARWPEFGELRACVAEAPDSSAFLLLSADSGFVLETGSTLRVASRAALEARYEREISSATATLGAGYRLCLESPVARAHRWQANGYYRTVTLDSAASRVALSLAYGEPPPESRCP